MWPFIICLCSICLNRRKKATRRIKTCKQLTSPSTATYKLFISSLCFYFTFFMFFFILVVSLQSFITTIFFKRIFNIVYNSILCYKVIYRLKKIVEKLKKMCLDIGLCTIWPTQFGKVAKNFTTEKYYHNLQILI